MTSVKSLDSTINHRIEDSFSCTALMWPLFSCFCNFFSSYLTIIFCARRDPTKNTREGKGRHSKRDSNGTSGWFSKSEEEKRQLKRNQKKKERDKERYREKDLNLRLDGFRGFTYGGLRRSVGLSRQMESSEHTHARDLRTGRQ